MNRKKLKLVYIFVVITFVLIFAILFSPTTTSENAVENINKSVIEKHNNVTKSIQSYRVSTNVSIEHPGREIVNLYNSTLIQSISSEESRYKSIYMSSMFPGHIQRYTIENLTFVRSSSFTDNSKPVKYGYFVVRRPYSNNKNSLYQPAYFMSEIDGRFPYSKFPFYKANFTKLDEERKFNGYDVAVYKANSTDVRQIYNNLSSDEEVWTNPYKFYTHYSHSIEGKIKEGNVYDTNVTAYINDNGVIVSWRVHIILEYEGNRGHIKYKRTISKFGSANTSKPEWVTNKYNLTSLPEN